MASYLPGEFSMPSDGTTDSKLPLPEVFDDIPFHDIFATFTGMSHIQHLKLPP